MILVSDDALAVGITAIPSPVTDIDDDGWMLMVPFASAMVFSDATGINFQRGAWFPFDSKAKRIVPGEGRTLAIVAENASATLGLEIIFSMRVLAQVRGTR